jgi:hypothetical protein
MPQIYDMGPMALLLLRRMASGGFFRPKNQMASAGFEPSDLGTRGQHANHYTTGEKLKNMEPESLRCDFVQHK